MSQFTPFRYVFHQQVPIVSAVFGFNRLRDKDGGKIYTTLFFAIDTAAQASVITPPGEAKLCQDFPSAPWDRLFKHGKQVDTIVGMVSFKVATDVYLEFLAEDGTRWPIHLPEILFCENIKQRGQSFQAGHHLPFCLLGQDVLRRCGVLSTGKHGLITPDVSRVDTLIGSF